MILSPKLRHFLQKNWIVVAVLAATAFALLWFGFNIVSDFLYFNDPRHQDIALKGWMTPRYVVMSYDLPRGVVADVLGLTGPAQRGIVMRDIALQMGISLDALTQVVRDAAATYREGQP